MADTLVVKTDTPNPSLEETAKAMGIDTSNLDKEATSQMADPIKPPRVETGDPNKNDKDTDTTDEEDLDDQVDDDEDDADDEQDDEAGDDADSDKEPADKEVDDKDGRAKVQALVDEATQEFWSNGQQLSEDRYKQLEEVGYDKRTVDAFIEGQKAVVELARLKVFTEVGGEQRYTQMLDWAKDTLTDAEIREYNKAVNSNDMDAVLFAVKNLKSRYQADNGSPARKKVAGKVKSGSAPGYTSLADMQTDMNNPRYQNDPVFRQRVERKLASSNIL